MADYLIFAVYMLLGQLSPGPDMLLIMKNSLNHGARAALFTIGGIVTGILIHTTVALAGLTVLLTESRAAYWALRIAGAAYVAYLGVRLLLAASRRRARATADTPRPLPAGERLLAPRRAFSQGLLTNLLNAKVIVIISSILLLFLGPHPSLARRLAFGSILVAEALVVWLLFALLLQTGPARRGFARYQDALNATFGALLVLLALRSLWP